MCVLIGPEVIINNAFLALKDQNRYFLALVDLQHFNRILYDKLTNENDTGIRYKYVRFQADWEDVEDFCRLTTHFMNDIDRVYCTQEIEEETVQKVNSIYTPDIQTMIQNAREEFCHAAIQ